MKEMKNKDMAQKIERIGREAHDFLIALVTSEFDGQPLKMMPDVLTNVCSIINFLSLVSLAEAMDIKKVPIEFAHLLSYKYAARIHEALLCNVEEHMDDFIERIYKKHNPHKTIN